ncbi:MAG TPA: hypothetical protein VN112_02300 [Ensifer sp.]|nr:hypothetical protein [Ensifer sp.]
MKVTIIIRELGRLKPDYSLDFELPELPRPGDYISINRPDNPEPYSEDIIVRQVWWRLHHPETAGYSTADNQKTGKLVKVFVECDPAVGPTASDHWRDIHSLALADGTVEEFKVARLSIRQDAFKG